MADDLLNSKNHFKTILLPIFMHGENFLLKIVVELQVPFSDHRSYPLEFVASLDINSNNEGQASVKDT